VRKKGTKSNVCIRRIRRRSSTRLQKKCWENKTRS